MTLLLLKADVDAVGVHQLPLKSDELQQVDGWSLLLPLPKSTSPPATPVDFINFEDT